MLHINRIYSGEKLVSAIKNGCDDFLNYRSICNQKSDVLQVLQPGMKMMDADEQALANNIKRDLLHYSKSDKERSKIFIELFKNKYPMKPEEILIEIGSLFSFILANIYYTACEYTLANVRSYTDHLSSFPKKSYNINYLSNASSLKDTNYIDPHFVNHVFKNVYNYVYNPNSITYEDSLNNAVLIEEDKNDIAVRKLLGDTDQNKMMSLMFGLLTNNREEANKYIERVFGIDNNQLQSYKNIFNYIVSDNYEKRRNSKKHFLQVKDIEPFVNFTTAIGLLQAGVIEYKDKFDKKATSEYLNTGVEGLAGVVIRGICDQLVTLAKASISLGTSLAGLSIIASNNIFKIMENGIVDGLAETFVNNITGGKADTGSGYDYLSKHGGKSLSDVDYNAYLKQVEIEKTQSFLKEAITTPVNSAISTASFLSSKGYGLINRHGVTGQRRSFLYDIYFRNVGEAISNIFNILSYSKYAADKTSFAIKVVENEYIDLIESFNNLPHQKDNHIGSLYFCFKLNYPWKKDGKAMDLDNIKTRVQNWRYAKFKIIVED